jgi:hypothetical protein
MRRKTWPFIIVVLFVAILMSNRVMRVFWRSDWLTLPYVQWVHDNIPLWFVSTAMLILSLCFSVICIWFPKYTGLNIWIALSAVTMAALVMMIGYDHAPQIVQTLLAVSVLFIIIGFLFDKFNRGSEKKENSQ